jgi:membrane protein DedA with SNARE-associated domain
MNGWKRIAIWAVVLFVICPLIGRVLAPLGISGNSPLVGEIVVVIVAVAVVFGISCLIKRRPEENK